MNYVFFDCECANCLRGEGKICSLGYVKTDENLNIVKKKDILVNPDAPFLLGNAKNGEGIRLAYPLFRFKWAHTFPSYYEEIKKLFTKDEETIAFGFAVHQDVRYLAYTCKRYNLPFFSFKFYDIQKLEQLVHSRKNPSALDTLIETYHLKPFTYHRSDDDALMTLEVLKGILDEKKMTIQQLLEKYPEPLCDTETFTKRLEEKQKQQLKKEAYRNRVVKFYDDMDHVLPNKEMQDTFFTDKTFFFESQLFKGGFNKMYHLATPLRKKGGKITTHPQEADYIVVYSTSKVSNTLKRKEGSHYLNLHTLEKKIKPKKEYQINDKKDVVSKRIIQPKKES